MTVEAGVMDRVEVLESIDIDIACEHSQHAHMADRHEGNAEWIQYDGFCGCPEPGSAFVCSKWRNWVSDHARTMGKLYCRGCQQFMPATDLTFTKI